MGSMGMRMREKSEMPLFKLCSFRNVEDVSLDLLIYFVPTCRGPFADPSDPGCMAKSLMSGRSRRSCRLGVVASSLAAGSQGARGATNTALAADDQGQEQGAG